MNEPIDGVDLEKTWMTVLAAMKVGVSEAIYNAYLRKTKLITITGGGSRKIAEVGCQSAFTKSTLEHRYLGQLANEMSRVCQEEYEIRFVVKSDDLGEGRDVREVGPLFSPTKNNEGIVRKANLREDYTFDNYAVGGSNQMAFAAAQAVSKRLGSAYNPLFIYGGVGVGKTHLMQAIGHSTVEKGETGVLFCPGEEFTNDLVLAIQQKTTEKIRNKYRKVKLLMIDDVQFIAGKPSVQEEFFHTFNAIQREGGQIVMTSDKPPSEIIKLEDRLRSRFGAGLIVDVGQPDFELKSAILLIKSEQRNLGLTMKQAQLIAETIDGIRELEGFLIRIKSEIELKNRRIDDDLVRELLNISKPNNSNKQIVTPSEVMSIVAGFYGVGIQQIKGERRTKQIAWARQVLMYLLNQELRLPLIEVGRLLGGRDHSTVIHARDKIMAEIGSGGQINREIAEIKKKLLTV